MTPYNTPANYLPTSATLDGHYNAERRPSLSELADCLSGLPGPPSVPENAARPKWPASAIASSDDLAEVDLSQDSTSSDIFREESSRQPEPTLHYFSSNYPPKKTEPRLHSFFGGDSVPSAHPQSDLSQTFYNPAAFELSQSAQHQGRQWDGQSAISGFSSPAGNGNLDFDSQNLVYFIRLDHGMLEESNNTPLLSIRDVFACSFEFTFILSFG